MTRSLVCDLIANIIVGQSRPPNSLASAAAKASSAYIRLITANTSLAHAVPKASMAKVAARRLNCPSRFMPTSSDASPQSHTTTTFEKADPTCAGLYPTIPVITPKTITRANAAASIMAGGSCGRRTGS